MVYSTSDDEKSYPTRLQSTKERSPKKSSTFKNVDKLSSKYVNSLHSDTSKKETRELKLSLKRIDATNYVSILSPSSLKLIGIKSRVDKSPKTVPSTPKNNSKKSLQWSERRKNDVPKLVEELLNVTDNEEENYEPNAQCRRMSISSCKDESDSSTVDTSEPIEPKRSLRASTTHRKLNKIDNSLEIDSPKRTRKLVNHFGCTIDLNETVTDRSPAKNKFSRKSSNNMMTISKSVTPKRRKKSVNRFGDISKIVRELTNGSESEEEDWKPNERYQRVSNSPCFDKSDNSTVDTSEPIEPKRNLRASTTRCKSNKIGNSLEIDSPRRTRKPVNFFGDTVDSNEIMIDRSPAKNKFSRRTSNNTVEISESVTPKRERKSVKRSGGSVNLDEMTRTRKPSSSLSSCETNASSKSKRWNGRDTNDISKLVAELMNDSEYSDEDDCKPNKRTRKPVDRLGESVDSNETSLLSTSAKYTKRTSSSTSKKSNNIVKSSAPITPEYTRKTSRLLSTPCKSSEPMMSTFETPKRIRKSLDRFGVSVDSNEVDDDTITPRTYKKRRNMSINEDDDIDFDANVWETPVNKHLRLCTTPTSRSGSKARRSILQDIPENEEIEVISTPKTPKKTKTHVKNLTPSTSKRSDSGARVPCSPLEKARANLHLHAAPKHLPCREIEFKSIHSYLARKINDELTGSMYISGVPGTGKTATVKRVIDSLNSDIIMKHSFKFVEINGLRLANPHQAFSVIWKELTAETVPSSRAQALLNDYFSGKKVRELSTILLVDEVDHICNRKQDVVYNILDWPSRTGSKVVVITIANTMDLPERVLRGCVTSRMGLTRLVFKPYTFQQLQEIIMDRLIGNSSFDPDAVQLVARKVAAVSGDARRALDVCRRAIDLIKSEDESQLITINHVNQVLNSILSGVRVTAIRRCSILEQFFLRALRDETNRTGFDHSTIESVYVQMKNICLLEGEELPNDQQAIMMAYRLRDSGLIFLEKKRCDIYRKVSLNVSPEDISYALDKYNV